MTTDTRRRDGQFERQLDDDEVLRELVNAEQALATNEVADRVNAPRTTAHDALNRLQDDGLVRSDLAHGKTRLWWCPGHWGDTRIADVYHGEPLLTYLETGCFPPDTDVGHAIEMVYEAFIELHWAMPLDGGYDFEEMKRLADLTNLSVSESPRLSPGDIHEMAQEGAIESVPTALPEAEYDPEVHEAAQFRRRRERAEISQELVADTADVRQSYLSMWENGRRDLPEDGKKRLHEVLDDLTDE